MKLGYIVLSHFSFEHLNILIQWKTSHLEAQTQFPAPCWSYSQDGEGCSHVITFRVTTPQL